MKKIGYGSMVAGILLFVISSMDLISILLMIAETLFSLHLHASFFGSFIFRAALLLAGALLLLIGALLLKHVEKTLRK